MRISSAMRKRLSDMGIESGGNSAAEFMQLIAENDENFGKAILAAGIKPE